MSAAALGGWSDESDVVDIMFLLDRLEEVVSTGSRLPFGQRVLVDEQECLSVIDQIRLALPQELKAARSLIADRDRVLAEASERAERLLERAEQQAAQRVDEHELATAAEDRAREVVEHARREADDLRREADAYAHRVFSSLHNRLRRIDETIMEGLDELRSDRG
jgi:glycyl-tRNA synthetase beta subunit